MAVRAEITADSVHLSDGGGWMITCDKCGGCFFDVTMRPGTASRVVCANEDCGKPIPLDAQVTVTQPGR